jgi:hypothetical protein
MGIISNFLDRRVDLYSITRTNSASGQPIESLVFSRKIHIFFNPDRARFYRLFDVGQVPADQSLAISEIRTVENQVLVVDGTRWRIVRSKPAVFKSRTLAYIMILERYQH